MLNSFYENQDYKQLLECIKSQFAGRVMLNREQTVKLLGIGVSTLDLRIAEGRDIPRYIKIGDAKNSRIAFSITDIAAYIFQKRIKISGQ
ncbi:helix-turn-helix transcriptional regulator [Campylobacter sp. RM16192]|uniref:helix-turn-helix transcriptional regulator n=1 Tax=Campylobacter sp. RM16192 TaxID=1660080 RepID=UPI0014517A51|nr:hypothetical protein [Campylobacter sp. RM16192]QCD53150.1 hypothetical protein CDOMC_1554 [Campylobacter sp. RM16192]